MNPPLYNSRIIDTFLKLIKARYRSIDINSLLQCAGMKAYEVADQGFWFTQEQVDRFYEELVLLTGNEHIAREAGRYAASPETLGVMRQYIFGLVGPTRTFELINKTSLKFTRSTIYESRTISAQSVEIIVTPHEGVSEKPYQCENRIGFFEAVLTLFCRKNTHIEHPECIFSGADTCRYLITWKSSLSLTLKRVGAGAMLLFFMASLLLAGLGHWGALQNLSYLFVPAFLSLVIFILTIEKNELKLSQDNVNETTDKLIEQIDSNFNNSLMLNEISQVLNNCTHSHEILELVINIVESRLNYDRGMVLLADSEQQQLVLQENFGYLAEHRDLLDLLPSHLDLTASGQDLGFLLNRKPLLINDITELKDEFPSQLFDFFIKTEVKSFICCPIFSEGKAIGLLTVDNVAKKKALVSSDVSLLMGVASVIGISLRNSELIKEKVLHEKEQLKIEQLKSLGVLAGGIAHDFNNILAGLYGNLSLAKNRMEDNHPGFRFLDTAEKSMNRATLLTNQLLTFAKGGEPVRESLSLDNLVEEVVCFNLSGSNVKPVITSAANLWLAKADQGQIQQVFANLTINAKQAMPDGGHLYITMENEEISKNTLPDLGDGRYIRITVADEGTGIAPEHLERIFEPYFTTKQMGRGLGMATVYSIVSRHGGHISATSKLGQGTTLTLYLPGTLVPISPSIQGEIDPSIQGQTVKILVMDDDDLILSMATALLEELSFTVETAPEGRQAIKMYQQALDVGEPFNLVLLDLTIPGGMGGEETAKNILKIDLDARMIVSSGYADDPVMANYAEYGFKDVVAKPYNLNKLSVVLARVLEKQFPRT